MYLMTIYEIEDEEHFLLKCKLYSNVRESLTAMTKQFNNITSNEEKMIAIMTSDNEAIITELSKYIYNCFKLREENINKNKITAASKSK